MTRDMTDNSSSVGNGAVSSDQKSDSSKPGRRKRRPPLVAQERTGALPLSFGQERLWFLDQLGLVGAAYNMAAALRLEGQMNVAALERSIAELISRHESLRTRFESVDGIPIQVIDAASDYSLQLQDLSTLSEHDRATQSQLLIDEVTQIPFNLALGPVFRMLLIKIADREHILLIALHHSVCDGWSLGVLNRELSELYAAHCEGRTPKLAELPVQPADYAIWQRDRLQGPHLEKHLSYWRAQLEGLATLELPTDRPRPAVSTFKGAMLEFDIPAALSKQLNGLSRSCGATPYMTLLAAFQVLLSRYSGQHDIAVGSPIAGRTQQELDGIIGFFVNTLVLRTNTSGNPTFRQVLERVRQATLDAYDHQDVPFAKLVKELGPERHLAQQPLFQVMFALHNFPEETLEFAGLTWTSIEIEHKTAVFDLSLHLFEQPQGNIKGLFEYALDLFDRETVERMARHLLRLLESIVEDSDRAISRLQMLTGDEREQVTLGWNATQAPYPSERTVHELFEEQVLRSPLAPAVLFADTVLSYHELNRRANQLAHYLRGLGVGPDHVIGIALERGLDMVVAILGILKAGGAYLPLDPAYPAERLRYMLEDAAPQVVLTQGALRGRLPLDDARAIALDLRAREIEVLDAGNFSRDETGASAQQLVFVIYTSGSTGRPKGIAMQHRSMVNLVEWHRRSFGSAAGKRVLQFAALSFDICFQEIFSTLCTGGTLVLLDEWVRRDVRAFAELLSNQQIERLFMPPLMLQSLAEHCRSADEAPVALRDVIVAGEQLRVTAEVAALFRRLSGCRLHNHYGPTETHVVTALTLSGGAEQWPALPSIGRPIANAQVYVLDEEQQPAPIGVRGEIYIGGAAVARGYLRRPELTTQRFVPDPFSADPQARLYRTGDVGRWRADGTIEFLGRNDDQVKIRGYRIELGEVEAQLARHAQVKDVAVVSRDVTAGGKSLVAYVTARGDCEPSPESLRAHLTELVPEYMVPSAFVVMESMPLTQSGKLDRRALPAPGLGAYSTRQYEAPEGDLEQTLARIWRGLLGVERVGRQDNFFELGGHSLLSVRLAALVSESLGLRLSVVTVFRHPTVQRLAKAVEVLRDGAARSASPRVPEFEEGRI